MTLQNKWECEWENGKGNDNGIGNDNGNGNENEKNEIGNGNEKTLKVNNKLMGEDLSWLLPLTEKDLKKQKKTLKAFFHWQNKTFKKMEEDL